MFQAKIVQNSIKNMKGDKNYWEGIYESKNFEETSWYQSEPEFSLNIIESLGLSHEAAIIDIGGGDSILAEALLERDYENLSVLDIAANVIDRAKTRLGKNASKIDWIVSDVTKFEASTKYDLWHDRVTFHFLTAEEAVQDYLDILQKAVKSGGYVFLATFSENGPEKCSGLPIQQYSSEEMTRLLAPHFEALSVRNIDHVTPWGAKQNLTVGLFQKK